MSDGAFPATPGEARRSLLAAIAAKPETGRRPTADDSTNGKTDGNVVVLGIKGSGKTVFLSVLGHAFQHVGAFGFGLVGDTPATDKFVSNAYARMHDDHLWPASTEKGSSVELAWVVKDVDRPLFRIESIDCAGEVIVEALAPDPDSTGRAGRGNRDRKTDDDEGFESAADARSDVAANLRERVRNARVVCLFVNPDDFEKHISEHLDDYEKSPGGKPDPNNPRDLMSARSRQVDMDRLLKSFLDTRQAEGKHVVIVIAQAAKPDVFDRIVRSGGAKDFLLAQDGKFRTYRGTKDADVIAVSAVNKVFWRLSAGKDVRPGDGSAEAGNGKVESDSWIGAGSGEKRTEPHEYPDVGEEAGSVSSGLEEFLLTVGGVLSDELAPLGTALRDVRRRQNGLATARRTHTTAKDRLAAANALWDAWLHYESAAMEYAGKPGREDGRAGTWRHLNEEEGRILPWVVAERRLDALLREAAAAGVLPEFGEFGRKLWNAVADGLADSAENGGRTGLRRRSLPEIALTPPDAEKDLQIEIDWLREQFGLYRDSRQKALARFDGAVKANDLQSANEAFQRIRDDWGVEADLVGRAKRREELAAWTDELLNRKSLLAECEDMVGKAEMLFGRCRDALDDGKSKLDAGRRDEVQAVFSALERPRNEAAGLVEQAGEKVAALDGRKTEFGDAGRIDALSARLDELKRTGGSVEFRARSLLETVEAGNKRRRTVRRFAAGAAAITLSLLGLVALETRMRPFRQRKEALRARVEEGRAILTRFDATVGAGRHDDLEGWKKRMSGIAGKSVPHGDAAPAPLDLDPALFVSEDRPTAEGLVAKHRQAVANWNAARNDLDRVRSMAGTMVARIGSLLASPALANAATSRSNLVDALDAMEALSSVPRPSADETDAAESRFDEAKRRAEAALPAAETWIASSQAVRPDAEKTLSEAAAAEKRMAAAANEARELREAAKRLRIDPAGSKLAALKTELKTSSETVRMADKKLATALKEAEARRIDAIKALRLQVNETVPKIETFGTFYGPLVSQGLVKEGLEARKSFDSAIAADADAWEKEKEAASVIRDASLQLRNKATAFCTQIDDIHEADATPFDGPLAAKLVGELAESSKRLETALGKISAAEPDPGIGECAARIQTIWKTLDAARPDLRQLAENVRVGARNAKKMLIKTDENKAALAAILSDGSGPAKAGLVNQLSACAVPATVETELQELEENNETGVDCHRIAALQKQMEDLQTSVDQFAAGVRQVEENLRRAESDRSFVRLKWEEGAQGVEPPYTNWETVSGNVLVPHSSRQSSTRYEWRFALPIQKAGGHKIEIKVEKTTTDPVNHAIDEKKFFKQERDRVKGGWIGVKCTLSDGVRSWADELWIPNYPQLENGESVLEAGPTLSDGYQSFSLKLELDANPSDARFQGWHPERLQFRVYLDGEEVKQFWHKNQ